MKILPQRQEATKGLFRRNNPIGSNGILKRFIPISLRSCGTDRLSLSAFVVKIDLRSKLKILTSIKNKLIVAADY